MFKPPPQVKGFWSTSLCEKRSGSDTRDLGRWCCISLKIFLCLKRAKNADICWVWDFFVLLFFSAVLVYRTRLCRKYAKYSKWPKNYLLFLHHCFSLNTGTLIRVGSVRWHYQNPASSNNDAIFCFGQQRDIILISICKTSSLV